MASILGLSHVTIACSSELKFEVSLKFYQLLGYRQVKGNHEDLTTTRQTWLRFDTGASKTAPMLLKIVLDVKAAAARPKERQPDLPNRYQDSMVIIKIDSIAAIKAVLTEHDIPFQETDESLLTADPNSNIVILTTQRNPLNEAASTRAPGHTSCRKICVMTSGGDSSGMNAVVRAVVLYGTSKGCDVYAVYEGYQGLVDGGHQIRKMDSHSVRGFLSVGGTSIGTARCMAFRERPGRLKAAHNLVKTGVDSLIICGGDGSLSGANLFRSEWPSLLEELRKTGEISEEQEKLHKNMSIVGLVGSIDNDMSGTDITIGAVTSVHRICEAIDAVNTTALSHSRAFVIEAMGRHCGWLTLASGMASGADFIFIPERPPAEDDWESAMCNVVKRHRDLGKRKTIIVVAEGALDKHLKPIKVNDIKDILTDRLGLDTRVTVLGHTQRGGSPCAFDRILATTQAIAAVDAVLAATPDSPSPLICMNENRTTIQPLMASVEKTQQVAQAIETKDFAKAISLRDNQFLDELRVFTATTILDDHSMSLPAHQQMRIAILHVGAPAGGMNVATRAAVRYAINRGHDIFAVANGFRGLARGSFEQLSWMDVDGWVASGGSFLGTNRAVPGKDVDIGMIAYQLQQKRVQALIVIGGFEGYTSLLALEKARAEYPSLCIPLSLIPATVSNNVPGTDFSLGCDTSLNAIVESCDAITQSAHSSRRRVFVVEVQGGRTGYLAVHGGLAVGACAVYIPEEGIHLPRLQGDVQFLKGLYETDDPEKSEGRVILRTEGVSSTYTTEVISKILEDEGGARFDSRTAVLGHIQQGGAPSPLDRIRGTRVAVHAVDFIELHAAAALNHAHKNNQEPPVELTDSASSIAVIGLAGTAINYTPVSDLLKDTDLKNRRPTKDAWSQDRKLIDILAGRSYYHF
ncbi:6-phosphofructokinase [Hesseltinella vesiculosa]|uniref:ATP-dependent 6-phosphofructokinase n=1 Tax=Hesseltinella vesiculosa TaxID=101127 RepID=A0A1X2GD68_9FUNG|nr:6-phosphofructokinase [Hesseltinella vesiculosa]